jgi:hypothetical protein
MTTPTDLRDQFAMAALPLVWSMSRTTGYPEWRNLTREENLAANAADAFAFAEAALSARTPTKEDRHD